MKSPRKWFHLRRQLGMAFPSVSLFILSLVPHSSVAQNLIPSGDFESGPWGTSEVARQESEEKNGGDQSLRILYSAWVVSPELVEIDPNAVYRLSAKVKRPESIQSSEAPEKVTFQLALQMFDANDNPIGGMSVAPVPDTNTRLAADAAEGSQEVRVDGAPWPRQTLSGGVAYDAIAFDAQDDFSDLPNHTSYLVDTISADESGTVIRLRKPLEKSYAAGTPVRQHMHAEVPQVSGEASQEWQEHFVEVSGVSEAGTIDRAKFWPGTKKIQAAIRAAGGSANEVELLVDDITLIEHK